VIRLAALIIATLVALLAAAPAQGALRAGVGRADITPKTGYYLGGWTRADRVARGQHTRLHSRALVLERDGRKLALVQLDLFMVPSGMVRHIGEALAARGFSERNILISASHTHSGPGGYANYPTFNTAAPSMETVGDPSTFVGLFNPAPADRQLYTFLTEQITAAIRRAPSGCGRPR
jgi:neutral ceramidase